MTTLREARIARAVKAINDHIERVGFGLTVDSARPLRRRSAIELLATHVVDALFTDHMLDNVLVDDEGRSEC